MYYEVICVNFRYFLRKSMIVVPALPLPQQSKRDPLGNRILGQGVIFSKNHVPPKCHLSQSASFAKIQEFPQSIFGKLLSINDLGLFLGVYTSERTQ